MSIIRRTLLIFLILVSVSTTAFAASRSTIRGNSRLGVDPGPPPPTAGSWWPDNGEPDDGNKKTNGGTGTNEPTPDPRDDLAGLVHWLGKVLMARNLGIGL